MPRRLVLLLATLALAASGCGADHDRTVAETEGIYLNDGGLKYQVQMSRYMNANDVEDQEYLVGLPEDTPEPAEDETWFGVWVRVQNVSDEPQAAADTWEIHDTQDNVFEPIEVDADVNPWVYEAGEVPPHTIWPLADSAPGQGPTQGLLLLFKVTTESLQNRPLELRFSAGAEGEVLTYDLDV